MNHERSPRFPNQTLSDSLIHIEKLYKAVGRSTINAAAAVEAIGYTSLNGASRTALAALSYYGVLQREGDMQKISELGLRLIRPLNASDRHSAARIASELPPAFAEIAKNHADCNESTLASILLHKGFTDDGARRAARVYKGNIAFIESLSQGVEGESLQAPTQPPMEEEGKPIEAKETPRVPIQPKAKMLGGIL